jgi:two-component system, OmpR family, response regulator
MEMSTNYFKRVNPSEKIIFIVEDNEVFAKSLQSYLQNRCPDIKEIKIFRIGEMCLLEMQRNPGLVIMDYFLNSKYEDAHSGLEIAKRIKAQKPQTNIIMLSVQKNVNVILESIKQYDCLYVQKDEEAFAKIEQIVKEIFESENKSPEPWN